MDKAIEEAVDRLFERAKKEKHIHSRSGETFDAIAGLWFLGDDVESVLSQITRSHIISSFLLKCLGIIYQRICKEYDIPDFQAKDVTDSEAYELFMGRLQKIKDDDRFVPWLQDSMFPVCAQLLDRVEGDNLEGISSLGNLADSTGHLAEGYASREDGEIWAYDCIFQLADELLEARATTGKATIPYEQGQGI